MPVFVDFYRECLILLRDNLLAVAPEEGCALLLGEKKKSFQHPNEPYWQIQRIWPCRNVWAPSFSEQFEQSSITENTTRAGLSRLNRYVIDPLEQLDAQRWARKNNLEILGSAHSHPRSAAIPSLTDQELSFAPGLKVIVDGQGHVRAWWVCRNRTSEEIQIKHLSQY